MNLTSDQEKLQLSVDREHNGLRMGTVALFAVIAVVTFIVINAIVVSEGLNLLAGIIAFAVAAIVTRLSEPYLKRVWPSKRSLELDELGARMTYDNRTQSAIAANATANVYYWCFKIPKRGRMPKGWFVVACALQQEDTYLAVYTFASPAQTIELNKVKSFTELQSENKKAKTAKTESLRLAGEQRRLRVAEEHRWHDGGELSVADFEVFVKRLNGSYERWNL